MAHGRQCPLFPALRVLRGAVPAGLHPPVDSKWLKSCPVDPTRAEAAPRERPCMCTAVCKCSEGPGLTGPGRMQSRVMSQPRDAREVRGSSQRWRRPSSDTYNSRRHGRPRKRKKHRHEEELHVRPAGRESRTAPGATAAAAGVEARAGAAAADAAAGGGERGGPRQHAHHGHLRAGAAGLAAAGAPHVPGGAGGRADGAGGVRAVGGPASSAVLDRFIERNKAFIRRVSPAQLRRRLRIEPVGRHHDLLAHLRAAQRRYFAGGSPPPSPTGRRRGAGVRARASRWARTRRTRR